MKRFIELFVDKKYRDRLLFESSSVNKRRKFFSRFAHNAEEVLDSNAIVLRTDNLSTDVLEGLFGTLKIEVPQSSMVFAPDQDSMELSYEKVLSFLDDTYAECIVMLSNGCAIVKEETERGAEKFVLYSRINKR